MRACPPPERLREFLEDSLDADTSTVLVRHFEGCAACLAALDRLSADAYCDSWHRLRTSDSPSIAEPRADFLRDLEGVLSANSTLVRSPSSVRTPHGLEPRGERLPTPAGYHVLEKLGRGGIGIVYKARDLRLKRTVALKMLLTGAEASTDERARLRVEAEAVARLHHPNIVQIYETGEQDGCPFLALEFVEGGSLARRLDGTPQQPEFAATLLEALARAMHYAHQHGIVHRDLKPANILLHVEVRPPEGGAPAQSPSFPLANAIPKIADFGLAKRLDEAGHTHTGQVLGTPGYMAPEQARGQSKAIGPAADIYALGAILYQMLTGRPPFQGITPVETIVQVLHDDPVSPGRLQPRIPADLETICLKCLAKESGQRYPSALELAEDLRRFLAGESIRARREGPIRQGWRWCRRHPVVAGLLAALVLVFCVGTAGVTWGYLSAEAARGHEAEQRERAELHLYQSRIALAEREWESNNVARAEYLLDLCTAPESGPDRRGWEWYYLKRLCRADRKTIQAHRAPLAGLAFSGDGKYLASSAGDRGYQNNTRTAPGELTLWAAEDFRKLADFTGHTGRVDGVAFNPTGARLASVSADDTLRLWDVPSGRPLASFPVGTNPYWLGTTAAFSPDGKTLAAPGPRELRLVDAMTGTTNAALGLGGEWSSACAFSPNGALLAAGCDEPHQLVVWNVAERRELYRCATVLPPYAVAFSPDNRLLAVAPGGDEILLLEAETGRATATLRGHAGKVYDVAWSRDGRFLASASADKTARIWEASTGREFRTFRGHTGMVLRIAYHPDGRCLVTGDGDGALKVWDVERDQRFSTLPSGRSVADLAFSADGRQVRALGERGLGGWEVETGRTVFERTVDAAERIEWPLKFIALSQDGRFLAAPEFKDRSTVRILDVETGQVVWTLTGHRERVRSIAFAPGNRWLATASGEKASFDRRELILWQLPEPGRGEPRRTDLPCEAPVQSLAFSADGRRLVAGERGVLAADAGWKDGCVSVWDTATGRQLRRWTAHPGTVQSVAVDPAGRWIASGGRSLDHSVRVWNADSGALLHDLLGPESLTCVTFNPDGTRLAAVGYAGTVHLWDPASGLDLLTLHGPHLPEGIANDTRVVFSPDGTRLAVSSWTGSIHIWDARPPTDK